MAKPDYHLTRLQESLHWKKVQATTDGAYLISLRENEMRQVQFLRNCETHMYIDDDEFIDIPICIRVDSLTHTFEYWTLNKRLHRDGGPAFIRKAHNDSEARRSWYWQGYLHREDGPAKIEGKQFRIAENDDGSLTETWNTLFEDWYHEGQKKNISGGPIHIDYTGVQITKLNGKLHNYGELAAITANIAGIFWHSYHDNPAGIGIVPVSVIMIDYAEHCDNGVYQSRNAGTLEATWGVNGEHMKHTGFDGWVHTVMLKDLNFNTAPFWGDDGNALIAVTEYGRLAGW